MKPIMIIKPGVRKKSNKNVTSNVCFFTLKVQININQGEQVFLCFIFMLWSDLCYFKV